MMFSKSATFKPCSGSFLLQAAKDFNIDLSKSIMIGDSERDVEAGDTVGCGFAYKINTNERYALSDLINVVVKK